MTRIKVIINGTNTNPFENMGLTQNPFPSIPKEELVTACLALQSLEGIPVKTKQDIRNRLQGKVAIDVIEICCIKFELGKRVEFNLYLG